MTDDTVRDQWGRPYVTAGGEPLRMAGKRALNAKPYTRVTTIAGALDDKSGLIDWAACQAAVGAVRAQKDNRALWASMCNLVSSSSNPWKSSKQQLKGIVAKLRDTAGAADAADLGTAFHGLTETLDRGGTVDYPVEEFEPWLAAYRDAMRDWEIVDAEVFTVCDELEAAGTPDRVLRHRHTGEQVIADVKTGENEPAFPSKVMTQCAIYAHSMAYDQATGRRRALDVSRERGLLIHVPIRSDSEPFAALYDLDLTLGWELAKTAVYVRQLKRKVGRLTDGRAPGGRAGRAAS